MAKATPLSGDIMDTTAPVTALNPRAPVKATTKTAAKQEKIAPLQIRIPASEAKAIKRAALEADQTISAFMLACFHAYKYK